MNATSQHALCAKAIKAEIKALAPLAKISARSESFSMGDSVHVKVHGDFSEETRKQISALKYKYAYGSFNGMEDIYEQNNCNDNIPQSKYVFISINPS